MQLYLLKWSARVFRFFKERLFHLTHHYWVVITARFLENFNWHRFEASRAKFKIWNDKCVHQSLNMVWGHVLILFGSSDSILCMIYYVVLSFNITENKHKRSSIFYPKMRLLWLICFIYSFSVAVFIWIFKYLQPIAKFAIMRCLRNLNEVKSKKITTKWNIVLW